MLEFESVPISCYVLQSYHVVCVCGGGDNASTLQTEFIFLKILEVSS